MEALKSGMAPLSWSNRTSNIGGRTRVIFNDPNDPLHRKVWAGSVTGGLWYNEDAYADGEWHPVDDFWPGLAVACMASDPISKNTYYVGTGESQTALIIYRESSTRGVGIMRSTDAGVTWELMPSTSEWAYVTDVAVRNEGGRSVIYAGVVSGIYKGKIHESGPTDGLFRSVDGGSSWQQVLPPVASGRRPYAPSDIEVTADGSRIFVGTTCHGEDREGAGSVLWSDNGTDWTVMDTYSKRLSQEEIWPRNQIPYICPGRVMLAGSASDPNVMYSVIAGGFRAANNFIQYTDRFLLKSVNKGVTWSEMPSPEPEDAGTRVLANLAWHAMTISVDPRDPGTLWMGGLDVWRTRNSGASWEKMSFWAPVNPEQRTRFVHADVHRIEFRPGTPDELLVSTDGGLFHTGESAADVPLFNPRNRSYTTLQYYYGAIHPEAGRNFYLGGLQDNGSIIDAEFDGQTVTGAVSGGDGFYCFIDENEPNLFISTVYYTWLNVFDLPDLQRFRNVGSINYENGTFNNPMDYDWKYNIMYANGCGFAGQNANTLRIVRISDEGLTPAKGTNLMRVPTQSQVPYSAIKWFVNSGEEQSTIYIGTEAGRLYRLTEAMVVGELTDMTSPQLPVGYISSIDIGHTEDTLMVTYSNYGVPSVFVTADGGQNWRNVEANLPDMPVRWGIFHPKNLNQVMLATETGIWTTDDVFSDEVTWRPDNQGLANVRVDMLKFRNSDNTVLAATHGRGMFTSRWDPLKSSGITDNTENQAGLSVFPNPSTGRFEMVITDPSETVFTIADIAGRVVLRGQVPAMQGSWRKSFDLTGQPKGVYLLKLDDRSKSGVVRLVLE